MTTFFYHLLQVWWVFLDKIKQEVEPPPIGTAFSFHSIQPSLFWRLLLPPSCVCDCVPPWLGTTISISGFVVVWVAARVCFDTFWVSLWLESPLGLPGTSPRSHE
jgi:hypothetical protein